MKNLLSAPPESGEAVLPHIRAELDEVWYLDLDDAERRRRLIGRRLGHGDTPEHATYWVNEVDEPNAQLVAAARSRADRVVRIP